MPGPGGIRANRVGQTLSSTENPPAERWARAGVQDADAEIGKNYITFHLMPVYGSPALREALSPELKKPMHGKACFNFTRVDPEILAELAALTARGLEGFRRAYPW